MQKTASRKSQLQGRRIWRADDKARTPNKQDRRDMSTWGQHGPRSPRARCLKYSYSAFDVLWGVLFVFHPFCFQWFSASAAEQFKARWRGARRQVDIDLWFACNCVSNNYILRAWKINSVWTLLKLGFTALHLVSVFTQNLVRYLQKCKCWQIVRTMTRFGETSKIRWCRCWKMMRPNRAAKKNVKD